MVSWMLILTHTISRKIMIRRFDLACGCSSKKEHSQASCRVRETSYLNKKKIFITYEESVENGKEITDCCL